MAATSNSPDWGTQAVVGRLQEKAARGQPASAQVFLADSVSREDLPAIVEKVVTSTCKRLGVSGDALKVGTLLLKRVDKLPVGAVDALFQLRNRGAYLALAQSLEEGILLDTGTLRTLAQMGYSQVAGRLTDDLLRFGWQSESQKNRAEEVWSAKCTLEQFLRDFGVQISLSHLRKLSGIQDFFYWADPPIRIDLSQLREEASALIDRHIGFWNVPSQEIVSDTYTDSCALDLAS